MWSFPGLQPPGVRNISLSASSNLSKLPFKGSYEFIAPVVFAPGKQILTVRLDFPASPNFGMQVRTINLVLE